MRALKNDVVGDIGSVLWVLMATVGMVLIIACANVANLLLVRAEGRQQELVIRAALGASRFQIARELLLESVILGVIGGALALGLAYAALRLMLAVKRDANAPRETPKIVRHTSSEMSWHLQKTALRSRSPNRVDRALNVIAGRADALPSRLG